MERAHGGCGPPPLPLDDHQTDGYLTWVLRGTLIERKRNAPPTHEDAHNQKLVEPASRIGDDGKGANLPCAGRLPSRLWTMKTSLGNAPGPGESPGGSHTYWWRQRHVTCTYCTIMVRIPT